MSDLFCNRCAHYTAAKPTKAGTVRAECRHPDNAHLVHGGPRFSPEELRYERGIDGCGLNGRWFQLAAEIRK